ncbi:DNA-binding transcriptional regulator, XRE-family HTH domain [Maribacter sedimenticola]|uniref:DNA-binding transcriptional regulator, XRE-family HTH domain n=1 Tax=Maribacter sedimenticola TaxID=228956 RepID=A0ABY1SH09_9FLAO|nr:MULTISPECIES: helix-turn-helix transcriptional regulator [Maribacter]TVZ14159.1 DNA-binding XRE family transcriptional regulator [Maribacter sp. MAR_2009_72]SNR47971.1 DNA-binding transcriptional regulator, XRE-family HTH domain [Maribacter sedimenticola]
MLDSASFIKRTKALLEYYNLSAAAFADAIHVQRSSISHLLSGRNKPSLEFVMKIHEAFPEVALPWLLYGKGTFPTSSQEQIEPHTAAQTLAPTTQANEKGLIDRIIIFYKDGTFKTYSEK